MQMKYIMYQSGNFMIFPETIKHSEIHLSGRDFAVSAGFIEVDIAEDMTNLRVTTHGESTTLNLKSTELDGKVIEGLLNSPF